MEHIHEMGVSGEILLKMGGALLATLPIAFDREKAQRAAGLRTFPIVAVTSCGFILTGHDFLGDSETNARLMQGLIGGLGFLGGGAILKSEGTVSGMATAASIWSAGAMGMAAAYGRWEIVIALSVINFASLFVGGKVKDAIDHNGGDDDSRPSTD